MADSSSSSNGIGFAGSLTVVFAVLKLFGAIEWSWLWIFSPIWIPIVILCSAILLAIAIAAIKICIKIVTDHFHESL